MLKSVCVLFSVLFVTPLAFAEIFKCVGKNGEALYQNFPCQFESISGTPTDAPPAQRNHPRMSRPQRNHPPRLQSRASA